MKQKIQLTLIFLSAFIASLGTYPYAKDFAHSLFHNKSFSVLAAGILIPATLSANMALGAYSLQNSIQQSKKSSMIRNMFVFSISLLSALATAFMCFVGFYHQLPIPINLLVSFVVLLINGGIGFSAINNAMNDVTKVKRLSDARVRRNLNPFKVAVVILTILSALLVALTAYLAITHGLSSLANYFKISNGTLQKFIYLFSVIIWLPGALLFANGSRITIAKIYDNVSQRKFNFSVLTTTICLVALFSGAAYAQMALEFFDTCKCIPEFFKRLADHYNFIFYFFMPLAFIISAIVNGYALNNLLHLGKKSK